MSKKKVVTNATIPPQIFYGLHMVAGVAEYTQEQGGRILIDEQCCKSMDPSFTGKPVYVQHVDEVDLEKIQEEADGYVIESFFNKPDGKHWAKFIVVSDEGHAAIAQGWVLSNAYVPLESGSGGKWHNVEYVKEITRAEFDHLAIVPNPRYEESIILTPEQFKAYNAAKELELQRLSNSKDESENVSMLNIFKRTKIENSAEIESATVTLSTGKEMTFKQLVNAAEASEKETKMNMDTKINVDDEEMSVNELVEKYKSMKSAKKNADDEKAKKEAEDKKKNEEMSEEDKKKKNAEEKEKADKEAEAKKNAEDEKAKKDKEDEEKKQNALHFEKLKNAHESEKEALPIETSVDQVARGKSRYGSN